MYDPKQSLWFNPDIQYIFNQEIIEYDLRDAGFNLIKQYNLLPLSEINRLEQIGKGLARHIEIGKLERDNKKLSQELGYRFADIRKIFITTNNISNNNILAVKKDALFVIGSVDRTKFGLLEFARKNVYSSYIRFININNLELYYNNEGIDIKGMSDSAINRHRLYMYDFLIQMIGLIESNNKKAKRVLVEFIDNYKTGKLDAEYYYEFNNMSSNTNMAFNYQNILIPLTQIVLKEVN